MREGMNKNHEVFYHLIGICSQIFNNFILYSLNKMMHNIIFINSVHSFILQLSLLVNENFVAWFIKEFTIQKSQDHTFRCRFYIRTYRPPPCSVSGLQPRLRLSRRKTEAMWLNHLWIIESSLYLFSIWQLHQLFTKVCSFPQFY